MTQEQDFIEFMAKRIENATMKCMEEHAEEIKNDETGEIKRLLLEEAIYMMGFNDRGKIEKM